MLLSRALDRIVRTAVCLSLLPSKVWKLSRLRVISLAINQLDPALRVELFVALGDSTLCGIVLLDGMGLVRLYL
jgi:hypothetical protein